MNELYEALRADALAHGFYADRRGWVGTICPQCGRDSRQHGKQDLATAFDEKGGKCLVCGAKFTLKDLAQSLSVAVDPQATYKPRPKPKPQEKWWFSRAKSLVEKTQLDPRRYKLWADYSPLFTKDVVDRFGLGVGVVPSTPCRHDRLTYSYDDHGRLTLRGRRIACNCPQKWLSAGGSRAGLWLPPQGYNGETLVIAESPVDAMLLMATFPEVYAIAGTAGAGTWYPEFTRAVMKLKPVRILVLFDNDRAGDNAGRVEKILRTAGATVTTFRWPKGTPEKADIRTTLEESLLNRTGQGDVYLPVLGELEEAIEGDDKLPFGKYAVRLYNPTPPAQLTLSAAEVRETLEANALQYLEVPHQDHVLILKSDPGVGKTWLGVKLAHIMAEKGHRVAYVMPRHDSIIDVLEASAKLGFNPDDWLEWQPISDDTCRYAKELNTWAHKGRATIDFCAGVCGWDYMKSECPYRMQAQEKHPIVAIQHQHLTSGHPLMATFSVVIGDELPLGAFVQTDAVPADGIIPHSIARHRTPELHAFLTALKDIAQNPQEKIYYGAELLDAICSILGWDGQYLNRFIDAASLPLDAVLAEDLPRIPQDAETADYWYIPRLFSILRAEVETYATGRRDYISRVEVGRGELLMHHRGYLVGKFPEAVVWLDATAREDIYRVLFERETAMLELHPKRKGKVYQVVDRLNNVRSIVDDDGENITRAGEQAVTLVENIIASRGYNRNECAVVTHKRFERVFIDAGLKTLHFHGARGSNTLRDHHIFVVGAPAIPPDEVQNVAIRLEEHRMEPLDLSWTREEVSYGSLDGKDWGYQVANYHNEPILKTIVELLREDEITHALHRGRIVNHNRDVWLLTNLPIPGLKPDELYTIDDIIKAPQGVNRWKWAKLISGIAGRDVVTDSDIEWIVGVKGQTAQLYLKHLAALPGWKMTQAVERVGGRGRPRKYSYVRKP